MDCNNENAKLDIIIDKISLSPSLYDKIKTRYESIGKWLDRDESSVKDFNPQIYCQGSVRIGTAIKPLKGGCYDVDLVCQLDIDNKIKSPEEIKELIGKEIKQYMITYGMSAKIEERKRCWTVEYADEVSFHVDVLPALHDKFNEAQVVNWIDTAIIITDNTYKGYSSIPGEWAYSNPMGFSKWLKEAEIVIFSKKEKELRKSLENIPEFSIVTPLKKIIMLLKRHRDIYFQNKSQLAPPSVLITTLVGTTYYSSNIDNAWTALQYIVNNMENNIMYDGNEYFVLNPANNKENFTDKWTNKDELREAFYLWLQQLKIDIKNIVSFDIALNINLIDTNIVKSVKDYVEYIYKQPHRKIINFDECNSNYQCNINKAFINRSGFRKNKNFYRSGDPFPKGYWIDFEAKTNVPQPFTVSWQVTNTGEEAKKDGSLRGGAFHEENNKNNLTHKEFGKYKGIHSLECLIFKDSQLVAKSKPFIVIIN